jgi:hypothetical protein
MTFVKGKFWEKEAYIFHPPLSVVGVSYNIKSFIVQNDAKGLRNLFLIIIKYYFKTICDAWNH